MGLFLLMVSGSGAWWTFLYLLRAFVEFAAIAGAIYGVLVFGSGGHSRGFWTGGQRHVVRWRRRWLALAMNAYLFGSFCFAALAVPDMGWLVFDVTVLLFGVVSVDRTADGGRVPGLARWCVPVAVAIMLGVAWGMGAAAFGVFFDASIVKVGAVAVLWSVSACLTAVEVWQLGAPLGSRSRHAVPA